MKDGWRKAVEQAMTSVQQSLPPAQEFVNADGEKELYQYTVEDVLIEKAPSEKTQIKPLLEKVRMSASRR